MRFCFWLFAVPAAIVRTANRRRGYRIRGIFPRIVLVKAFRSCWIRSASKRSRLGWHLLMSYDFVPWRRDWTGVVAAAIRCGIDSSERIHLSAGAGVAGSDLASKLLNSIRGNTQKGNEQNAKSRTNRFVMGLAVGATTLGYIPVKEYFWYISVLVSRNSFRSNN